MDQKTAQRLQSEMNEEVKRIQDAQKRLSSLLSQRAKLLAQQNENEMVEKELRATDGDGESECAVWKLVGPVLVKVEADEARSNVASRLKWFKEEMSAATAPPLHCAILSAIPSRTSRATLRESATDCQCASSVWCARAV